jgi:hypothetical protein
MVLLLAAAAVWAQRDPGGPLDEARAVDRSLAWLSAQQHAHTGAIGDVEETALAMLAMLGGGFTDRGGARDNPHAACVRQGLRSLLAAQRADGTIGDTPRTHAIAATALAEAFWMTRNPRYRKPAQAAIDALARTPVTSAAAGGDVLTIVWRVFAVKSAKFATLAIDAETLFATRAALAAPGRALTAAEQAGTLVARIFLGEDPRTSTELRPIADSVLASAPSEPEHWYLGTLAMFHYGRPEWRKWHKETLRTIARRQRDAKPEIADQAMVVMSLEVFYRFECADLLRTPAEVDAADPK